VAKPGQSAERLTALLAGSLEVWSLADKVTLIVEGGTALLRATDGLKVRVEGSAAGWRVRVGEETRGSLHAGVPGMLRAVRRALAPEQRPGRMIVAPAAGTD
jgi:hypothetical protein